MKGKNKKNSIRKVDVRTAAPEIKPETAENNEISEAGVTVTEAAEDLTPAVPEKTTAKVSEVSDVDPDFLTGDNTEAVLMKESKTTAVAVPEEEKKKNEVKPIPLNLSGDNKPTLGHDVEKKPGLKSGKGMGLVIGAVILVILVVGASIFLDSGIKDRMNSPLQINGTYVDSAEFSFMYHYLLIDNGVDIFAADTPEMLAAAYEDENYATNRDYFLDLTAQEMRTMQLLYDDAKSHGLDIEEEHYVLARTYIDWLSAKAEELGVSLDTYIRGVFGNQVNEQIVLNTLAKKYFTEDYASGEKLIQLQATEEQAEEAYMDNRNAYDVVSYKILRITYEQREEAFIETANLHAQQIVDAMGHDQSEFEACAAEYFSGAAQQILMQPDSTLVSDARYQDFTHNEFRDWLFDTSRVTGDAEIFSDNDGFPIILCFVSRDRQSVPLRDARFIEVSIAEFDGANGLPVAEAQQVAQSIYDSIETEADMQQAENLYNDYILNNSISVTHSTDTYPGKYDGILDTWIMSPDRESGNKAFLETPDAYYIVYMVNISDRPEWYDRVNSFIRMNNYQAFLNEMESEYDYRFIQSGLDDIVDVP